MLNLGMQMTCHSRFDGRAAKIMAPRCAIYAANPDPIALFADRRRVAGVVDGGHLLLLPDERHLSAGRKRIFSNRLSLCSGAALRHVTALFYAQLQWALRAVGVLHRIGTDLFDWTSRAVLEMAAACGGIFFSDLPFTARLQ